MSLKHNWFRAEKKKKSRTQKYDFQKNFQEYNFLRILLFLRDSPVFFPPVRRWASLRWTPPTILLTTLGVQRHHALFHVFHWFPAISTRHSVHVVFYYFTCYIASDSRLHALFSFLLESKEDPETCTFKEVKEKKEQPPSSTWFVLVVVVVAGGDVQLLKCIFILPSLLSSPPIDIAVSLLFVHRIFFFFLV